MTFFGVTAEGDCFVWGGDISGNNAGLGDQGSGISERAYSGPAIRNT